MIKTFGQEELLAFIVAHKKELFLVGHTISHAKDEMERKGVLDGKYRGGDPAVDAALFAGELAVACVEALLKLHISGMHAIAVDERGGSIDMSDVAGRVVMQVMKMYEKVEKDAAEHSVKGQVAN